ncbi:hypothetical protein AVEN_11042-1 [Araneus ventricosus]|uniref:Uncharacterized protein n=1 Tax=Araneus ventricosus TaxID=182803 RepID=A0A4Y2LDV3_ARAVE|nr:hypothetical protein AVEN_11042-1 [Araneus ventricosus]
MKISAYTPMSSYEVNRQHVYKEVIAIKYFLDDIIPDSNFSLQQACHKFVMGRVQVCHDKSASLQQVNESFEVTMKRTCSKLAVQTHCEL